MFAVLKALEYYGPRADNNAYLPGPALSVTSQKCAWGPRERNVDLQPIIQTMVKRAKVEEEWKKMAITFAVHDSRGDKFNPPTLDVSKLRGSLPANCRFCPVLPVKRKFMIVEAVFHP